MSYYAIQTTFQGWQFRSRAEARWAVFFDTLGLDYEYEVEGYYLDGIQFLPDFYLPEIKSWIEIKSQVPSQTEKEKAKLLSEYLKKDVYIFYNGMPWPNPGQDLNNGQSAEVWFPNDMRGWAYWWTECKYCGKLSITERGQLYCCYEEQLSGYSSKRLQAAYYAARGYRF